MHGRLTRHLQAIGEAFVEYASAHEDEFVEAALRTPGVKVILVDGAMCAEVCIQCYEVPFPPAFVSVLSSSHYALDLSHPPPAGRRD